MVFPVPGSPLIRRGRRSVTAAFTAGTGQLALRASCAEPISDIACETDQAQALLDPGTYYLLAEATLGDIALSGAIQAGEVCSPLAPWLSCTTGTLCTDDVERRADQKVAAGRHASQVQSL